MGWLERCYQVYEKNLPHVGKPSASIRYGWDAPVLLRAAVVTGFARQVNNGFS